MTTSSYISVPITNADGSALYIRYNFMSPDGDDAVYVRSHASEPWVALHTTDPECTICRKICGEELRASGHGRAYLLGLDTDYIRATLERVKLIS